MFQLLVFAYLLRVMVSFNIYVIFNVSELNSIELHHEKTCIIVLPFCNGNPRGCLMLAILKC